MNKNEDNFEKWASGLLFLFSGGKKTTATKDELLDIAESWFDLINETESHYIVPKKGWLKESSCKDHGKPFVCASCKKILCQRCHWSSSGFHNGKQFFHCSICYDKIILAEKEEEKKIKQEKILKKQKEKAARRQRRKEFVLSLTAFLLIPFIFFSQLKTKYFIDKNKPTTF